MYHFAVPSTGITRGLFVIVDIVYWNSKRNKNKEVLHSGLLADSITDFPSLTRVDEILYVGKFCYYPENINEPILDMNAFSWLSEA